MIGAIRAGALCAALLTAAPVAADDAGLFRASPVDTPRLGVLRAVNSTYYSKIGVNSVLVNDYAVEQPRVLTSATRLELGLPWNMALTATIPYYADLFSQQGKRGHKSGGGDIDAGLRVSFGKGEGVWDRFGLTARVLIPEKLGYGAEPLGFRTFSTGEFGYSLEAGARMHSRFADWYLSAATYQFPGAPEAPAATPDETFYDTGFGYRGIGPADRTGFTPTVFLGQVQLSAGGAIPVRRGVTGLLEVHAASFTGDPERETILRLTPGVRLGRAEGLNAAVGMDFGLAGPVPRTALVMRLSIPSLSPRELGRGLGIVKKAPAERQVRARNALVAVPEFSGTGNTLFDDRNLRHAFQGALGSREIVRVVPAEQVDRAIRQESLNPVKDSPGDLGVRIGAEYLIRAEIVSYRAVRTSRFTLPFIIKFPSTSFTLTARASVADLASGKEHDLGVITATVVKERGMLLFPLGPSSDLRYLSEPETRLVERELADRWVDAFNTRVLERMDLFDWEPKRTESGVSQEPETGRIAGSPGK